MSMQPQAAQDAVSARQGTMGIIPGSIGAKSFIVRGPGNEESFFHATTAPDGS